MINTFYYVCPSCNARVGTNSTTGRPLGTLANYPLREKRKSAHKIFDKLWLEKYLTRDQAYQVLAEEMSLDPKDCHIGMFNERQCIRVISIARKIYSSFTETRATWD